MSIVAGERIGPYEIVAALGAGGMGEVYRARDSRLSRDVALKLLPASVAGDPDRLARLSREAVVLASLNHPHIAHLYGVEERAGPAAAPVLVMELIDGPTLADRMAGSRMTLEDSLPIARQIASALEYAHDLGIIHRDLKPANVKLRPDGTVKLLDFGLAKAFDTRMREGDELANTPTVAADTASGVILGTAAYMAPEQVRGRPVDKRADIWAFGVVLFEMLAGSRMFPGDSASDIMAAVIRDEPPWGDLPADTPPPVRALLRRCLVRDPKQRLRDIGEARVLLEGDINAFDLGPPPTLEAPRSSLNRWRAAAVVFGIAAIAAAAVLLLRRPEQRAPFAVEFALPQTAQIGLNQQNALAPTIGIAPDGRYLAQTAPDGLVLWTAATGSSQLLDDTAGATAPFFSPDGESIAFFARETLRRVSVSGGPSSVIASAPAGGAGTWGRDGTIIYSRWLRGDIGVWRVPARGGEPQLILPVASAAETRGFPSFLPDAKHYVFLKVNMPVGQRQICIGVVDNAEENCIAQGDSNAAYSATGHLIFVRAGALVALPFNAETRTTSGSPITLVSRTRWFGPVGIAAFAVSADGRVLAHAAPLSPRRLTWRDRAGKVLGELGAPGMYNQVQLSPDRTRVAVDVWNASNGGRDLWVIDIASGTPTRVTFEPLDSYLGSWSSDRSLLYSRPATGPPDVVEITLGESAPRLLVERPGVQLAQHASADGTWIAYVDVVFDREQRRVWLLRRGEAPRLLRETPTNSFDPRFSPDSRTIAFASDESGAAEIYVMPLADGGQPRRVSRAGGFLPRWRADGRELFFLQPDGALMSVDPASASTPVALFRVDGVSLADTTSGARERYAVYDVTPDGNRFLFRMAEGAGTPADALHVWVDWARRLQ
jgi:eukaryotic-like serine/threonine-protein kinase